MYNNTPSVNEMKIRSRGLTEKVISTLVADPKYDISGAEWSLWVSYRKKTKTICLTPTITHENALDNMIAFHSPLFHYLRNELLEEPWDLEELKCFMVNTCFQNTKSPPKRLPEKTITLAPTSGRFVPCAPLLQHQDPP